jgi:hypothetical protein
MMNFFSRSKPLSTTHTNTTTNPPPSTTSTSTTDKDNPPPIVTVIGLGILGTRIVAELASCFDIQGGQVIAFDSFKSPEESKRVMIKIVSDSISNVKYQNKIIDAIHKVVLFPSTLQEAVEKSHLIIEAIIEDIDIKQKLFEQVEQFAPPQAVFATNTLSIRLNELARTIHNPRRLIGLRFLFPVIFIPFVEITSASTTLQNKDAANSVSNFIRSLHKIAFEFNMDELWEGEQEAHALSVTRGFYFESLQERQYRMNLVGGIRYRLQDEEIQRHTNREAKSRYDHDGTTSSVEYDHDNNFCVVCLSNPPTVLTPTCGHMVMCKDCCKGVLDAGGSACPVCRAKLTKALFIVPMF